ncbi:hypothetical protein HUJ04_013492 [Dendroctonus ponderosae]|nr:hypothetical protein HUJ04_013492 [Dendroctonus ponderosae]
MPDLVGSANSNVFSTEAARAVKSRAHNVGLFQQLRGVTVVSGNIKDLPPKLGSLPPWIHPWLANDFSEPRFGNCFTQMFQRSIDPD